MKKGLMGFVFLAFAFFALLGVVSAYCGDGILDAGEECDDGNDNVWDSCREGCTLPPLCGDGIKACECGDVVTSDYTMTADLLDCPYELELAVSDNVALDCDGHTITVVWWQWFAVGIQIRGDNSVVRNCKATGFYHGIQVHSVSNVLVENNEFWDNYDRRPYPYTGAGIFIFNTTNSTIRNNYLHDNDRGIYIPSIARYNIITNNTIKNSHIYAVAIYTGEFPGQDVGEEIIGNVFENNLIEENGGWGIGGVFSFEYRSGDLPVQDNIVRNNIIRNNYGSPLTEPYWGYIPPSPGLGICMPGILVEGNEIYGNDGGGIRLNCDYAGTEIHNNNIYDNGEYELLFQSGGYGDVDATNNYWGVPGSCKEVDGVIYDKRDLYYLDRAHFEPFLNAPYPNGVSTYGTDYDKDGARCDDNCYDVVNINQRDTDNDFVGDYCNQNIDADRDGWRDEMDNCPSIFNPDQLDSNGDGAGDLCQPTLNINSITTNGNVNVDAKITTPTADKVNGMIKIWDPNAGQTCSVPLGVQWGWWSEDEGRYYCSLYWDWGYSGEQWFIDYYAGTCSNNGEMCCYTTGEGSHDCPGSSIIEQSYTNSEIPMSIAFPAGTQSGTYTLKMTANNGLSSEVKDSENFNYNGQGYLVFADTDNDGIADAVDECPTASGSVEFNGCPAAIKLDGDITFHWVVAGDKAPSENTKRDIALEMKAFALSKGSCAKEYGDSEKNYENIWNNCPAVNSKYVIKGGYLGLPKGKFLIIGKRGGSYPGKTVDVKKEAKKIDLKLECKIEQKIPSDKKINKQESMPVNIPLDINILGKANEFEFDNIAKQHIGLKKSGPKPLYRWEEKCNKQLENLPVGYAVKDTSEGNWLNVLIAIAAFVVIFLIIRALINKKRSAKKRR